jgi:hypothetical protein
MIVMPPLVNILSNLRQSVALALTSFVRLPH